MGQRNKKRIIFGVNLLPTATLLLVGYLAVAAFV